MGGIVRTSGLWRNLYLFIIYISLILPGESSMMDRIFWGGEEGERERQTSRSSTRSDSEEGGVARVLLIDCPCVFVNWIGGGGDA